MSDLDYPVLYVMVRTDLPSMTPGKAQAHSGHAANAFIYKSYISNDNSEIDINVKSWILATPQGFGTQINLKAPWLEVCQTVENACRDGLAADLVFDPTYPYIVDEELLNLINKDCHTSEPVYIGDGKYMCFRNAATAAYIFGMKSVASKFVSNFVLHP